MYLQDYIQYSSSNICSYWNTLHVLNNHTYIHAHFLNGFIGLLRPYSQVYIFDIVNSISERCKIFIAVENLCFSLDLQQS